MNARILLLVLTSCTQSALVDGTAGSPDAGQGGGGDEFADAAICVEAVVQGEPATVPVDIIWAVDTSGSMAFEATAVETNLNAFAAQVDAWGIDYRVIMVAEQGTGGNEVCVPAPLGGAGCGDGPRYLHVPLWVGSHNALGRLIEAYPAYQGFLREGASKQFVVVSDDESDAGTDDNWFRTALTGLSAPGFPDQSFAPHGFVFHSIVAWGDDPNRGCSTGADIGESYLALTELTGGVKAKVCETDWTPIFAALQTAVMEGTRLPCAFEIPAPPDGETLDPDSLNVVYTPPGGAPTTVPRVDAMTNCGPQGGWYYDQPTEPSQVIMCPATCEAFDQQGDGQVQLQFGCATVVL